MVSWSICRQQVAGYILVKILQCSATGPDFSVWLQILIEFSDKCLVHADLVQRILGTGHNLYCYAGHVLTLTDNGGYL